MNQLNDFLTIKKKAVNLVLGSLVTAIIGGVIGGFTVIGNDHFTLRDYVKKVDGHETTIQVVKKDYVTKEIYENDRKTMDESIETINKNIQLLLNLHLGKKGE